MVGDQLHAIVRKHLDDLEGYIKVDEQNAELKLSAILDDLDELLSICSNQGNRVSKETVDLAGRYQERVERFLVTMNHTISFEFALTPIGQILERVNRWRTTVDESVLTVPDRVVWAIISPVQPDCLRALAGGLYEATWWCPVPMMDIELLGMTEDVEIISGPFEPSSLLGALSVRFTVSN
jgi:hypothetical protein